MKKHSIFAALFLMICLVCANIVCTPDTVSAKAITKISQAKKLAKKQVKGASIIKAEKDDDNGTIVYEVKLSKGKKKYQLVYRASDSKLLSYEWEIKYGYIKQGSGKSIGVSKCKNLAKKQVPGASITSISKKQDDGISIYKVKMKKSGKKFELRFNAHTGKLLEYEWELTAKNKNKNSQNTDCTSEQITVDAAKEIAAADAGVSVSDVTFTKAKLDREDGILVYEIEFITATHEYEYEINASTGAICSKKKEVLAGGGSASGDTGTTGTDIGIEAAKQIALTEAGGGTITKAKADKDDGISIYEIEVINGEFEFEIKIHAQTGKILEIDKEYKENPTQPPVSGETQITLEAAKEAAIADAGVSADEVTFTKAELDREDGILVYDIEFYTATHEYEYEIHAFTGAIYSRKKEVLAGGQGSSGSTGTTGTDIGIEAAKQIALKEAGGVAIEKAELELEDGVSVYEIKIKNGGYEYEIKINAQTGEVLEVEVDPVHD